MRFSAYLFFCVCILCAESYFYLPFLISITGGLRPAETFGLTFQDFDYEKKTVTVNKQVIVENNGLRVIKKPKTENSYRSVAMPQEVFDELVKRRKRCAEGDQKVFALNKQKFVDYRDGQERYIDQPDFINVDAKGKYIASHSFTYWSKMITKNICQPKKRMEDFSFYTFRKTNLSRMCTVLPLQAMMGHAEHSKSDKLIKYYYENCNNIAKRSFD